MNIKQAIDIAKEFNIEILDVKRLLEYILNVDAVYLVTNAEKNLSEIEEKRFIDNIKKIKNGYPLQYITHTQEFFGNEFYVDERVLIPQPDTECLIEQAIKIIDKQNKKVKVLDLCTGSGAIAITLKNKYKEGIEVYASDISKDAIDVAKINARKILKNENEIHFIESDMFENIKDKFDVLLSNPPYIKTEVIKNLSKDVQKEPHLALDGGKDGLDFYRIIRKKGTVLLNENGILIMEIGYDQKSEMLELFKNAICVQDYQGLDRVIIYKKENE